MTFGFCNAPSTFQGVMNKVFFEMLDYVLIVYSDDILIYSKDVESHERASHAVFERLAKHKFYICPEKCALLLRSVEFFGHVVDHEGVKV